MGDFNSKHTLWGSPSNDTKGKLIFKFIQEKKFDLP